MGETHEGWILVAYGEVVLFSQEKNDALDAAQEHVEQYIVDHLRHAEDHALVVTDEVARSFDIRVYRCDQSNLVALPFQEWANNHFESQKRFEAEDEAREYKTFVALREKYEARYQAESKGSPPLPNCS